MGRAKKVMVVDGWVTDEPEALEHLKQPPPRPFPIWRQFRADASHPKFVVAWVLWLAFVLFSRGDVPSLGAAAMLAVTYLWLVWSAVKGWRHFRLVPLRLTAAFSRYPLMPSFLVAPTEGIDGRKVDVTIASARTPDGFVATTDVLALVDDSGKAAHALVIAWRGPVARPPGA